MNFKADVQRRLSAEAEHNPVRPLFFDDLFDKIGVHRQKINLIRQIIRRLNRRNIGIDQNRRNPLFFQGFNRLTAGIVELSGLPDAQRP